MADPSDPARSIRRAPAGLVGGTSVRTASGWCRVESLHPGQEIKTHEGSAQILRSIHRYDIEGNVADLFPDGLVLAPGLGPADQTYLLPDQQILASGQAVERLTGQPLALAMAAHLVGAGGLQRVMPVDGIEVFNLGFDAGTIIVATGGLGLHCGRKGQLLSESASAVSVIGDDAAANMVTRRAIRLHRVHVEEQAAAIA